MSQLSRIKANLQGIASLLSGWFIATGSVTLLCALTVVVSRIWLPFLGLALFLLLRRYLQSKQSTAAEAPTGCYLVVVVAAQSLLISSLLMLALNLVQLNWVNDYFGIDCHFSVVSTLIVAPVTLLVAALHRLRHGVSFHCRSCRFRQDYDCNHTFLGDLFRVESVRQLNVLMALALLISIAGYTHYFWRYVAVNINHMDTMVFCFIPLLAFVLAQMAAALQYGAVRRFYLHKVVPDSSRHADKSIMRFLVVSPSKILLCRDEATGRYDTPAAISISRRTMVRTPEAKRIFAQESSLSDFTVRFLFGSPNFQADCNVLHYLTVVNDDNHASLFASSHAEWFTMAQLQQFVNNGELAPRLTSELNRIFLVARTWRTYDRHGRRRFAVKDYVPQIRLDEVAGWDVEFDDPVWLKIATTNEDKPLFGLRRLWHKINAGGE